MASAFARGVHYVKAHTMPTLYASIRVLEKNDFVFISAGPEEGTISYEYRNPQQGCNNFSQIFRAFVKIYTAVTQGYFRLNNATSSSGT